MKTIVGCVRRHDRAASALVLVLVSFSCMSEAFIFSTSRWVRVNSICSRKGCPNRLQLLPSQASELVEASSESYRRLGEEQYEAEDFTTVDAPTFGDGLDDPDFYDWNHGCPDVVAAMSPNGDMKARQEGAASTTTNAARAFVARVFSLPSTLIRRHPHPTTEGFSQEAGPDEEDVVLFPIVGCRLVVQKNQDNHQRVRSLPTVGNPACRIRRWDESLYGWFLPLSSPEDEGVKRQDERQDQ